ncbi:MAG: hypothetical protein VKJ06_06375 [Vampirovibrionales bacterium]|nr:hypothetical protein [Vampirovibrionales bacterium]
MIQFNSHPAYSSKVVRFGSEDDEEKILELKPHDELKRIDYLRKQGVDVFTIGLRPFEGKGSNEVKVVIEKNKH